MGRSFAQPGRMIRTLPLCLLAVLLAVPARADEVRLKNGDRITGVATSLAGGTLAFKATGGDLKIAWADVASLAIEQPMLVTIGTAAPTSAVFAAADANGRVTLVPGGPVALTEIVALARPQPAWTITGGAGAGIVQTAGNTQVNNIRLSGDLVAKGASDRYTLAAVQAHAEDRGIQTARNWSITGKYDRFLTSRLYANANANFTNDEFRDFDLRTALGAGLGYQIIETARTMLTADAGLAWVHENFKSIADDSYTAFHESAGLQVQLLPGRMQVFHLHDGYFGVSGDNKMFIRTQNGVRLGLAAGFVTTIEEDVDYDRRPSPGRRQTDRTFSLTLGYRF
jgi:putative salt-induced outer membrane protein YdiY